MAFTYDIATQRGQVRFLLADTDEESAAFSDAEVDHAINTTGSVYYAVGYLARALLADRARRARAYQIEGATYDDATQVAALQELVKTYGQQSPALPRASIGTMGAHPSDPSATG